MSASGPREGGPSSWRRSVNVLRVGDPMRLLLSALAWAILSVAVEISSASAQQPGRVYKVGWLWIGRPDREPMPAEKWTGEAAVFRDALRDSGFVLGKNLIVENRHARGDAARLDVEVEALVASGVDVIVTQGTPPTVAAMRATRRIPVVFFGVGDPVEKGIVSSLARPGGHVTGMAVMIAFSKQWQLLREVAPSVRRAAFLGNARPGNRATDTPQAASFVAFMLERMKADAAAAGIEPIHTGLATLTDLEPKFAELARGGGAGVVVVNDAVFITPEWRPSIMEKAIEHRLPTSCAQSRLWAESGCLVTYYEDWNAFNRGAAAQVVKVLRGTAPADIPVEQPTDYKLVVNAKTAKALDLTVPPSLLARADEVIE
jgi:putative ABC transport system substrate-binding protein